MEVRVPAAWRIRSMVVAMGLAALSGGCGNADTTTVPDANRTTDTFTGTVSVLGSSTNSFVVQGNGNLDATLVTLTPATTVTMGFGVGQPSSTGCGLLTYLETSRVGTVLSGGVSPGSFCVSIYDIGNLTAPVTYTITVVHP